MSQESKKKYSYQVRKDGIGNMLAYTGSWVDDSNYGHPVRLYPKTTIVWNGELMVIVNKQINCPKVTPRDQSTPGVVLKRSEDSRASRCAVGMDGEGHKMTRWMQETSKEQPWTPTGSTSTKRQKPKKDCTTQ
ncbi:hypothetical protein TruAng_005194 [Truncatella angustata]|nr:hypothetical protein TruAng_005194 [Truncatella angustata]